MERPTSVPPLPGLAVRVDCENDGGLWRGNENSPDLGVVAKTIDVCHGQLCHLLPILSLVLAVEQTLATSYPQAAIRGGRYSLYRGKLRWQSNLMPGGAIITR